jgi:8-oxo-dGTP diphosphatase
MTEASPIMLIVTAAVLVHDDRILIARRPAGDRLAGYWEFPGGKLENGETPRACLKREMYEEFGIQVRIGAFVDQTEHRDDHLAIRLLVFEAEIEKGEVQPTVHDAIRWVAPDQMPYFRFAPADRPIVQRLQAGSPSRQTRKSGADLN